MRVSERVKKKNVFRERERKRSEVVLEATLGVWVIRGNGRAKQREEEYGMKRKGKKRGKERMTMGGGRGGGRG